MSIDPVKIMTEVLKSALAGSSIAMMQYPDYLPQSSLHKYVEILQHDNLIKYDTRSDKYTITRKGRQCLQECNEIQRCMRVTQRNS